VWCAGENVIEAFEKGKTHLLKTVTLLPDPTRKGLYELKRESQREFLETLGDLDLFFPVLHGSFGEDGTIQGLFELAGVAYVGAGVLGSSLGMDKGVFKDVMRAHHIPVVDGVIVFRPEIMAASEDLIVRIERIGPYPLFTKPANLGSSVGVTKCRNRSDLMEGLLEAARFDRRVLVERGVNAREIEISVLGNHEPQASLPGEICPAADFYSYDAKYHDDRSALFIPANLPASLADRMRATAIEAYKAMDGAGMARVDFLLDKESSEFYLNEVNTIPGFTVISMYPKLWEATGIPYPRLVDRLVELALERREDRDKTEWRYQH
jgi:D-alanine-D-alanine ligase